MLHPVGHPGKPYDVAYAVVYLASDESKFVAVSELVIDAGFTAQQYEGFGWILNCVVRPDSLKC